MDAASLLGKKAPRFTLRDQAGHEHDLEQYQGRWVALYFYPKDDTPGCVKEACNFRDSMEHFEENNMVVLGVSRDSVPSHTEFAQKYDLNFPILSDEKLEVMRAYGAWGKKTFMGREYEGVIRTTFLIDPEGIVRRVYPAVKADTHVAQILADFTHLTH
jgi:peroxiredoxin Q/BCP